MGGDSMMMKQWFLTNQGVIVTASILTLVALIENRVVPWAPFHVGHALLALAIPLWLKAYRIGTFKAVRWWHWVTGMVTAVLFQLLAGLFLSVLVPTLFGGSTLMTDIGLSLPALFETAASRWQTSPASIQSAYLLFIFVWAAVGEELFYRGYMQGVLEKEWGLKTAVFLSAAFFGIRHAMQLALLWPDYPWIAAAAWVLFAALFGAAMSLIYHRTRSLILPIFIHFLFNLLPLLAG
jgi:membrane protease YdiL (CAAX protease family)